MAGPQSSDGVTVHPLLRIPVGLALLAALASGLWGLAWGLGASPRFVWSYTAFEAIIVLAAVAGAQLLRKSDGPAIPLALLCIGGTVFTAATLGHIAVRNSLGADAPAWSKSVLTTRVAASGALAIVAGIAAVTGRRGAIPALFRGVGLLVIAGGLAAAELWALRPILAATGGTRVMIHLAASIVIFIVFAGFFSVGMHLLIRAFDPGAVQSSDRPSQ